MLFSFLQYVKPIWYLNRVPASACPLIDYRLLSDEEKRLIDYCPKYTSESARLVDAGLQAWFKGFVDSDSARALSEIKCCTNVFDNYLFIRRFFGPFWSWYTLLLRLLGFHNPVLELRAFIAHRRSRRIDLFNNTKRYPGLEQCSKSDTGEFVSVIIPTLNRYKYLADVLRDLENQEHRSFEVIVVDQSDEFAPDFYKSFSLDLCVIRHEEKALWKARNDAIRRARGELVLLFDDDSRVESDWIKRHLECLEYFRTDLSSGVSLSVNGGVIPKTYSHYKWSDQVDTGNVMIRKSVFNAVGLFDRQFEDQRMGDAEFGMRCYLAGLRNISNPRAARIHLKVGVGGLREMGGWDAFRPGKLFSPRPVPSVLYYFRKYYGNRAALLALVRALPMSFVPYSFKHNRLMLFLGFLVGAIFVPLLTFQVIASWKESTKKLRQGARIEFL